MSKTKKAIIEVQGAAITVVSGEASDYISLTDIAKFKNPDHSDDVIRNWLRNRNTVEFLGVWERLNNPDFNPVEFDGIRIQTGLNSFLTADETQPRWGRMMCGRYSQGSSCLATLGCGPESRWDSPSAQARVCQRGGLGKAHQLFGDKLAPLLGELNTLPLNTDRKSTRLNSSHL